jgi:hypothetical protein
MLAMSGALLAQVNVTPERLFPLASLAVAVNVSWALVARKLVAGLMIIALTAPGEELPPHPDSSAAIASKQNNRAECAPQRDLGGVV